VHMKILWCVNVLLPEAAKAIGAPQMPFGGWMASLSSDLAKLEIALEVYGQIIHCAGDSR